MKDWRPAIGDRVQWLYHEAPKGTVIAIDEWEIEPVDVEWDNGVRTSCRVCDIAPA